MLSKKIFKFLLKHEDNKLLHYILHKFSNNGFIVDEPSEKDYNFGYVDTPKEVLQPDGQWIEYLPEDETQRGNRVDPMACVSFSMNNCIEMLMKRKWDAEENKSDRYLAKTSNTRSNGNTQRRVGDALRNYGAVSEGVWSYNRNTFTWSEYYKTIPSKVIGWGKEFTEKYNVTYEAVDASSKRNLMEALKYSPLWIAGYAWMKSGDKYVGRNYANHCFTLVGYVEGSHWIAYDSYSPYVKLLDWNFPLFFPKVVTITHKNEEEEKKARAKAERNKLIKRGFEYIQRTDVMNGAHGEVYRITENGLEELSDKMKAEIGFRALAEGGKNTGVTESLFKSLI